MSDDKAQGEFRCPQCKCTSLDKESSNPEYARREPLFCANSECTWTGNWSDVLAARQGEATGELVVVCAKTVDGKPLTREQAEELHRVVNERHKTPHGICPWCNEVYPLEGSSVREFAESHLTHCNNHPMRVVEQQLAAEQARADRLAAEGVMLRESLELARMFGNHGEVEFGEHQGKSVSSFIEKALANSPAASAEAERVRRQRDALQQAIE